MEQIIVRHAPISDKIIVVLANSKRNGQVDIVTEGVRKTVGIDYYQATEPVSPSDAKRVAQEFARATGIPEEEVMLRQRFPKTKEQVQHNRRTNDANLTLVPATNGEKQNFAKAVQGMQDDHDAEKKADKKQEDQPKEQKASADNPDGATVEKQKRRYVRKDPKSVSKRQAAALRRYHQELEQSKIAAEGVKPASEQNEVAAMTSDEEKLAKALRLAKLLVEQGLV